MLSSTRLRSVAVAATLFVVIPSAFAESPNTAKSEEAGFTSAGLARIDAYIKNEIAGNKIPGAIMMIQRNGKTAYFSSFGVRDPGTKEPMTPDSIFRIYSMSKPITTVAAMMLVEEGKLQLAYQPGTTWDYSQSTDILGRVIEVVSGKSLYQFEKERLLDPLGMKDTSFYVTDPAKKSLVAEPFPNDRTIGNNSVMYDPRVAQKWESGGGGMV